MHRLHATIAALLVLMGICLAGVDARAQSKIAAPGTSGDQLLFFYDATSGRTPFLVVSNLSPSPLTLDIAWYPQDLGRRLATQRQTLAAGANVVLDPSQVQGVNGNAGITVVTPIVEGTEGRPVVPEPVNDTLASAPSGPLVGGFTLADLSTGSAFGQNPLARVAVTADGKRAAAGSVVDGTTVRYQRIAPDALTIPFYFNPTTAGFTNRAILGAFEDRYATDSFGIGPASVDLQVGLIDATGADVASSSITVTGVQFTDVQTLADATPLTSSGKVVFGTTSPLPESANLLGLMSQSLGTFSVGQGLPGYFARTQPEIVLANADFDLGRVGWGQESQNFPGSLIVEGGTGGAPTADSGTRLAWLGRVNGETSDLVQVIDVPAGVGPSFLKARFQTASEETDCNELAQVDALLLLVDGVQVDGIVICSSQFNTGPTWTDFSFVTDLAGYAGKTIALRIRMRTSGTLPSSVFLDSLRIDSAP